MRVMPSDQNVSVSAMMEDEWAGCLDATLIESGADQPYWWLARVKVNPKYRRKGIGRQMIGLLVETVKDKGYPIVVAPGGYDLSPKAQQAFYRACGFKIQRDRTMRLEVA
jgi:predicted N-acetyltransferase YhbS